MLKRPKSLSRLARRPLPGERLCKALAITYTAVDGAFK